jgi:D-alanyl-D-alanine carboxypeptidase
VVASAPPVNPVQMASALAEAAPEPQPAFPTPPQPPATVAAPAVPAPGWAIQVGAFASPGLARAVAEGARAEAPAQLQAAAHVLPAPTPGGGSVLYQARLTNLTAADAIGACSSLNSRQLPCVVVPAKGA